MPTTLATQSYDAFYQVYKDIKTKGKLVSPRGQKVLEIENYNYVLPPYVRFASFEARKLKIDYIKKEFLWYLKGDRFDLSITEQASLWKTLINDDGSINSNYGQYLFFPKNHSIDDPYNQFGAAIQFLADDKDSRRASMMILSKDHIMSKTNDLPCTYAINFRIRDNKLNMTVRMRSQDMVYGMGNDAPTFSFTHEMACMVLRLQYPSLELGEYYHSCDSAHIYERHFEMLEQILDSKEVIEVDCPKMLTTDVGILMLFDEYNFPRQKCGEFIGWITDGTFTNKKE